MRPTSSAVAADGATPSPSPTSQRERQSIGRPAAAAGGPASSREHEVIKNSFSLVLTKISRGSSKRKTVCHAKSEDKRAATAPSNVPNDHSATPALRTLPPPSLQEDRCFFSGEHMKYLEGRPNATALDQHLTSSVVEQQWDEMRLTSL